MGCIGLQLGVYQKRKQISLTKMYFDPKMTLEEYEDFKLHDEINIGYDVEDDDLPDELEDESYIDGLLTSGFHAINDSELFGEEIVGYSLY